MDSWSDAQLKKMYTGGNDNCAEFLKKHGVTETSACVGKYDTPAAHLYQKVIFARVRGEPEPTELPDLTKRQPRKRRSLKMEGFGSGPKPAEQQKGLFQRLRTMSMNDDVTRPDGRGSASSAPSSGNIGELPNKPSSISGSKSMEDFCDVDISERTASEKDGDKFPIEAGENKEEEEEDAFNLDDLVNEIEDDMGFLKSRWSDAAKESKTKDMNPPGEGQETNNNEDGILRRISRSSWFGGGQAAKEGQNATDKLEEEIKKNEHDDIMSILEDDTVATVATSQSPSAPQVPPEGKDAEEVMPSPPAGFFRKVSRTLSGPRVRRDTREADEALDKFMDGL